MNTSDTAPETKPKPARAPRNGVDTPLLLGTIGAVSKQPELARFTFRASNTWVRGTHSETRMERFSGAGGEHTHAKKQTFDADHPQVLCGKDEGPTPVEYLLIALASCITAGIANIAAARGVTLDSIESTVEGDIDLLGIFGLSDVVRNGYDAIRISFRIRGDAPAATLRELVEQSRRRSAVFDVLTRGTSVRIDVAAE